MRNDVILGLKVFLLSFLVITEVSAQPKFTPKHGLFFKKENVEVTLEPSVGGAEIRYTLDGSEPSKNSKVYLNPLVLKSTTILRAKEYHDGVASASATATYLFMDSILSQSNTPIG